MVIPGMAIHTVHIVSFGGHVDIEIGTAVLEFVFDVAPLEIGTATGTAVATQAHRAFGHRDTLRNGVEPFLVLPENWFPLPVAIVVLIEVAPIPGSVADQAVDVLKLIAAHLRTGWFAQSGVALRTALGYDFALNINCIADPTGQGIGAEIIHRVHFAKLLTVSVDDVGRLAFPLVVLAVKEGLCFILVALQAGGLSFVGLEVIVLVAVGSLGGRGNPDRQSDNHQRQ
jgi:hypothetical protein